ncbi:MAG: aminotransferase class I/II-fold pyridoxal phosphate-dependent enzyme [Clostridia bacterium]
MDAKKLICRALREKPITARASRKIGKPIDFTKISGMGLNENVFGMSKSANEAIHKAVDEGFRYGDFQAYNLKSAIANEYGVDILNVITASGSSPIIDTIALAFLDEGDEMLTCLPTFHAFTDASYENLAVPVFVDLTKESKFNLDGMLEKITAKTKLIVICNPNNPTGTYVAKEEIEAFLEKVPDDIIVVFDEAYIEFATAKDCVSMVEYMKKNPEKPIIVLRTFSKFYGLAGIRAGYSLASKEITAELSRCSGTWNVSKPAQVGAIEALKDKEHSAYVLKSVEEGRNYLSKELEALGCEVFKSQTNFVYYNTRKDTKEVFDKLLEMGVHTSGGHEYNRVTVATMKENEFFIKCMKEIMQ